MSCGKFVTKQFCYAVLVIAASLIIQSMFGLNVNGATVAVTRAMAETEQTNAPTSDNPSHVTAQTSAYYTGTSVSSNDRDTPGSDLVANTTEPSIKTTNVAEEAFSNARDITTESHLTTIGDFTTKTLSEIDDNVMNPEPTVTPSVGDIMISTMFPLNGMFPFNETFDPFKNESDDTTLPSSLVDMPCDIIEAYGGWSFVFIYPPDQVEEALCRCMDYCEDSTIPPDLMEELRVYIIDPLSAANLREFIPVVSAYSLIFIVGVGGNILILIGLSTWMKQKTPTYGFIMSLACSDLLLLCICLPLKVMEFFRLGDVFTNVTCKISYYLRDFIMICSVLTLTVISFERYYAICKPFMVQYLCTWSRARRLIVITWTLSLALALPTMFVTELYEVEAESYTECLPQTKEGLYLTLYFTYCSGVLFALPSIIMACTYGQSCHVLWRSTIVAKRLKGMESKSDNEQKKDQSQKDTDDITARKKVVRGLVCIVALFTTCWGPSLVTQLITGSFIIKPRSTAQRLRLGFESITYISSAINPYLFMTMSSQFCEPLRCLCYYRRKPQETTQEPKTRATEFTSNASRPITDPESQTKY